MKEVWQAFSTCMSMSYFPGEASEVSEPPECSRESQIFRRDYSTIRTLKVGKPDYTKETPDNYQGMTFFPKSRPCKHWTGLVLVCKVPRWTPEFTARLQRCKLHTGQHLKCWSRAQISGRQAWKEVYITSGPSTERLNAHFCFVRSHSGRILSVVDGKARLHQSANKHGRILPQTMFAKLNLSSTQSIVTPLQLLHWVKDIILSACSQLGLLQCSKVKLVQKMCICYCAAINIVTSFYTARNQRTSTTIWQCIR